MVADHLGLSGTPFQREGDANDALRGFLMLNLTLSMEEVGLYSPNELARIVQNDLGLGGPMPPEGLVGAMRCGRIRVPDSACAPRGARGPAATSLLGASPESHEGGRRGASEGSPSANGSVRRKK